ncbi:DUF1289 domain-containing protein [Marinomonas sp. C2222]|uniref:DUF1289 domain-containing protein n=1 Tax=Marinomonas sargassi TaxID=2984494 RepID=A0ABT2YUM4_9GAMM|nr:DUF1289 domain-containing protein [Marinomonas sargassi]MCV2403587.1 DUF1289 domain-containing protein [Marinomonas sargassi]
MKRQKSPCIDACDFSHQKGWCAGCGRTRPECNQWKNMKPYDINKLQKELQKRLGKMAEFRAKNKLKG